MGPQAILGTGCGLPFEDAVTQLGVYYGDNISDPIESLLPPPYVGEDCEEWGLFVSFTDHLGMRYQNGAGITIRASHSKAL